MSFALHPARRHRPEPVETLGDGHRDELSRLLDADPFVNVVLASRLRTLASLSVRGFGGTVLGVRGAAGELTGAAFAGGNLLPVGGGPDDWQALGEHLRAGRRSCSSIVGRDTAVQAIWPLVEPAWGPARAIRGRQLLLALDRADAPAGGDPRVRPMHFGDLAKYLPAAAAMFTEELGISPLNGGMAADYHRRVTGLIRQHRAWGITDAGGEVLFKADIGAVSDHTCQLQGVWVRPDLRGRGLGRAALPVVLRHALTLAPTVSLYVNDFNTAACRMYARLGLRHEATLTTVLF